MAFSAVDFSGSVLARLLERPLRFLAWSKERRPQTAAELKRQGVAVFPHEYYHPFVTEKDLNQPLDTPRELPGFQFDLNAQMDFVRSLRHVDEVRSFPSEDPGDGSYWWGCGSYRQIEADILYGVVRTLKPQRICEIGCGASTRLINTATRRNQAEDPTYRCQHVCIEPYEQPWLEDLDVAVIREKVELCELGLFTSLRSGDILFIDSSHIIRPQGDVLFEYLRLLPILAPGVLVHIHDIFTPRDYPADWVLKRQWLWNEQYLLEAFLSMNSGYEILAAANWLTHSNREALAAILPSVNLAPSGYLPSAFWMRRNSE